MANAKAKTILAYGFNSPFEEFAISLDLAGTASRPSTHGRSICPGWSLSRRFLCEGSAAFPVSLLVTENGVQLFRPDHNYLTIRDIGTVRRKWRKIAMMNVLRWNFFELPRAM